MGYDTFIWGLAEGRIETEKLMEKFEQYYGFENIEKTDDEIIDLTIGSVRWRDFDEDMKEISKDFPGVLFSMNGEGEEREDIWRAWFKNGRGYSEYARIKYPLFDENKMEE